MAPADVKKDSTALDLPIALACLAADSQFSADKLDQYLVNYLTEAVGLLADALPLEPYNIDLDKVFKVPSQYDSDFADVRGQESAKHALTVAAGGHHNLMLWPIYPEIVTSSLRVASLRVA